MTRLYHSPEAPLVALHRPEKDDHRHRADDEQALQLRRQDTPRAPLPEIETQRQERPGSERVVLLFEGSPDVESLTERALGGRRQSRDPAPDNLGVRVESRAEARTEEGLLRA